MSVLSIEEVIEKLTNPERLYSRSEVLAKSSPVPKARGIYAWYFQNMPVSVPTDGCKVMDGKTLLYAGISPNRASSQGTVYKRITQHYKSKARSSTLRKSLGVLLYGQDSTPLRITSMKESNKFSLTPEYEEKLNYWMMENAFVCWLEHEEPWNVEHGFIGSVLLPLNIDGSGHPFSRLLGDMRIDAQDQAKGLPPLK